MNKLRPHRKRRKNRFPRKTERARAQWRCKHWADESQNHSRVFARVADAIAFAARFAKWKAEHGQPLAWIVVETQEIAILSPWREVSR